MSFTSKITDNNDEIRYVHAHQAQALFDTVKEEAASKGMKLNSQKTTLLCSSAARSYTPKTNVRIGDDDVIISEKNMKLLGFNFDTIPTVDAHVSAILKKVCCRTWSIHNLKWSGMSPAALILVFKFLVRSCFDYSCVVYHSLSII